MEVTIGLLGMKIRPILLRVNMLLEGLRRYEVVLLLD
jgi:hypothetical protein